MNDELARARSEIIERIAEHRNIAARHVRQMDLAERELMGFDRAVEAMGPGKSARRDLRAEVLNQLSHTPKSVEAIQRAIGARKRDIERVLCRAPLQARMVMGCWVRVGEPLAEAAE